MEPELLARMGTERGVLIAALVLVRLLPVVVLTPLFGGTATPRRFRIGVSILFALALAPGIAGGGPDVPARGVPFAVALAHEALTGASIAVFVRVVFEALVAGGALMDLARGASWPSVFDPTSRQQTSPLGNLSVWLFLTVFVTGGGLRVFVRGFAESFERIPAGAGGWMGGLGQVSGVLDLVAWSFVLAVRIAAPVVLVMLVLDVALGLLNRTVPQVQVFFLGMVVKGAVGVLVLAAFLRALSLDLAPVLFEAIGLDAFRSE